MRKLDDKPLTIEVDEANLKRRGLVAAMRYQGEDVMPDAEVLACEGKVYVSVKASESAFVYRVHKVDDQRGNTLRIMKRPPVAVRAALGQI